MKKTAIGVSIACMIVAAGIFAMGNSSENLQNCGSEDWNYVDIVTELERREAAQAGSDGMQIIKADQETGLAVAFSSKFIGENGQEYHTASVQMPYEGEIYTLVFRNDEVIGYFPPDATAEDQLMNRMETDPQTRDRLQETYEAYIEEFTN